MCNGNIRVLIFILNLFASVMLALVIIDRVFPQRAGAHRSNKPLLPIPVHGGIYCRVDSPVRIGRLLFGLSTPARYYRRGVVFRKPFSTTL